MPTITYKFRLWKCREESRPRVLTEMRSAFLLYNDLVAIERDRRSKVQRFWAERGGYVELLEAMLEARRAVGEICKTTKRGDPAREPFFEQAAALRQQVWGKEAETKAQVFEPEKLRRNARKKEIKAAAKAAGKKLSDSELSALLDAEPDCVSPRDQLRLKLLAEYAARGISPSGKTIAARMRDAGLDGPTGDIEEEAKRLAYEAYAARGVSPGTRGVVTEAFARSLKKLEGKRQRFKEWDDSGCFGVQVTTGDLSRIRSEEHTQLQILPLPDGKNMTPGSRRADKRRLFRVRIDSGERRRPVFADFEGIEHREIHPKAVIAAARVLRRRVGIRDVWHIVLVANVPDEGYYEKQNDEARGAVAVDLGWRSHEGDLRVGFIVDDRGRGEEITTPRMRGPKGQYVTMRERYGHARSLQSLLSGLFTGEGEKEGILPRTARWLGEWEDIVPDELKERTKGLVQWRSQDRFAELVLYWRDNRFEGDEVIFEAIEHWLHRYRHLHHWEDSEREHVLAARLEHYRQVAVELARNYKTIIINGGDLAKSRERKRADQTEGLVMVEDRKRAQAFDAAPGELRAEIMRAAAKYGVVLVKLSSDSMTCHACGEVCDYDRDKHLVHECEHCGARWDQDLNAAKNMLREWSGAGKTPKGARKPPTKRKEKQKPGSDAIQPSAE